MSAGVKKALERYTLATCRPMSSTGEDAPAEILPMIYSIATLMEMGLRKYDGAEAAFENVNPELIALAFDGIAELAALADFRSRVRDAD